MLKTINHAYNTTTFNDLCGVAVSELKSVQSLEFKFSSNYWATFVWEDQKKKPANCE